MNAYLGQIKNRLEVGFRKNTNFFNIVKRYCQHWQDILISVLLGLLAVFSVCYATQLIAPGIVGERAFNIWFDGDSPRIYFNLIDPNHPWHERDKVHPLFSLLTYPFILIQTNVFHVEALTAINQLVAAVAFLWIIALFALLRLMGCYRLDAVVLSLLGAISAASMFWFVVPETYAFGSLSMLIALCFVALTQYQKISASWSTLISTLTLSFTTTNWMVGIFAAIVNHPYKRALQITVNALCLTTLLWAVEKRMFPATAFFLGDSEEQRYVALKESGGPFRSLTSFFLHTMVMPAIHIVDNIKYSRDRGWTVMMSTQSSIPGSGSVWGPVSVWLWVALLGLGLWALFSLKQHRKLRVVLGLSLLGQLALHLIYGRETFLYALHFIPFLVALVGLSTLTRFRPLAIGLAILLVLTAGINNGTQLNEAMAILRNAGPQRYQVQAQMSLRPKDPWPRGVGHVVLAAPGSREVDKAYHEPGGSFSPAVGSFGISVWLPDQSGNLQATSDSILLRDIEQQLDWSNGQKIPGVLTTTKDYQTHWTATDIQDWRLHLKTSMHTVTKPVLAIRSVGPAGGPINSLNWDGKRLLINDRWSVTPTRTPAKVYLGEEGHPGWLSERSDITQWQGETGWGYARFELANGSEWDFEVQDSQPDGASNGAISPPSWKTTQTEIDLSLPDKRFADSLNAQVAHLMMGIVGQETRPGEPMHYPLASQRDGAYEVVALARTGQLQVAKELSAYFAENDFFGGFGSEADAPGLSIWALTEVASRLKQPAYDQYIWSHVRRKADFILQMMTTTEPIRRAYNGIVVPKQQADPELSLVAEPAKDGLIIGRMDNQRPLLFVNAVSYRGLIDAAALAERLKQPVEAQRWRTASVKLQRAWEKTFQSAEVIIPETDADQSRQLKLLFGWQPPVGESQNDRTYISSLWPTWVATNQKAAFTQTLQARWQKRRDDQGGFQSSPLRTYFDLAEAHQWLFVNQPEPLWKTLEWFWHHQTSPGLYTWGEGSGEENSFNRWEKVRGWVKPPNVTPHYWTAAEMALLQLDMLAYTDLSANSPAIVIGAGVRQDWLKKPMSVRGLLLPNGKLDWQWDGQQMWVKIVGDPMDIRLGSVFPANTPLKVEYTQRPGTNT